MIVVIIIKIVRKSWFIFNIKFITNHLVINPANGGIPNNDKIKIVNMKLILKYVLLLKLIK